MHTDTTHPTSNDSITIPIQENNGELLADSRDIAAALNIAHRTLMATIDKHKEFIESEFKRVLFQKAPFNTPGGVQQIRYALLTEDQAIYVGTLSRNTSVVMQFKATLVKAFSAARRALEAQPAPMSMPKRLADLSLTDDDFAQALYMLADAHKEKAAFKRRAETAEQKADVFEQKALTLTIENGEITGELEDTEQELRRVQPKVAAFDRFLARKSAYPMKDVADLFDMGRTTLYQLLRDEGILLDHPYRNKPNRRYGKYFRVLIDPARPGRFTPHVRPEGVFFLTKRIEAIRRRPASSVPCLSRD